MSRISRLFKRHEAIIHLVFALAWTIAIVPTLLWWKDSVLWVALMSLWANIASHAAAYAAARSGKKKDATVDTN